MARWIFYVSRHKAIGIEPYKFHTHEYQPFINVMLNPLAQRHHFRRETQTTQPKSEKCHLPEMNSFSYQIAKLWNKLRFAVIEATPTTNHKMQMLGSNINALAVFNVKVRSVNQLTCFVAHVTLLFCYGPLLRIQIRTWVNNYIHSIVSMWLLIHALTARMVGGFTKSHLKWGRGWMITPYRFTLTWLLIDAISFLGTVAKYIAFA